MAVPIQTRGVSVYPSHLSPGVQRAVLDAVMAVVAQAPYFTPRMPRTGKPFSVQMTNCGPLGWVSDRSGYRYQPTHPETGRPWPPIPDALIAVWQQVGAPSVPEACLINHYRGGAKMGLHQDRDEETFDAPVVSISLGDTAVFRIGGTVRSAPTGSIKLSSGDVIVLGDGARLAYHGVDRVIEGSSRLLPEGGRINLTLRRVTPWKD
ncbi:MAG: alpha-ketoglutarate-dependent dioxygenase AlkB [Pseudomonadota bacterium]